MKHLLLQSLLVDRFKLTLHRTTQDLPGYALVIARNGPRLREGKTGLMYLDTYGGAFGPGDFSVEHGIGQWKVTGHAIPIASLVQLLSGQLGRAVLDQTGLKGKYDFTLQWTPVQSPAGSVEAPKVGEPVTGSAALPIMAAIQEQLGLKLEPTTAPAEVLVIDHIERPAKN